MSQFINVALSAGSRWTPKVEYKLNNTLAVLQYPCDLNQPCEPYQIRFPAGHYKIELFGASGGYYAQMISYAGHGAYVSGIIDFNVPTTLFAYLGEQGQINGSKTYNGGGKGTPAGGSGGGASDLRITSGDWNDLSSLKSRVMIAAGGSGSMSHAGLVAGGDGGNENGIDGKGIVNPQCQLTDSISMAKGATQISGCLGSIASNGEANSGTNGDFGEGGYPRTPSWGSGAGGGYYGGGGCGAVNCFPTVASSGSTHPLFQVMKIAMPLMSHIL